MWFNYENIQSYKHDELSREACKIFLFYGLNQKASKIGLAVRGIGNMSKLFAKYHKLAEQGLNLDFFEPTVAGDNLFSDEPVIAIPKKDKRFKRNIVCRNSWKDYVILKSFYDQYKFNEKLQSDLLEKSTKCNKLKI